MVIDFHHHLLQEDGYEDKLLAEMDRLGIQYTCISGLGIGHGKQDFSDYSNFSLGSLSPNNDDVLRVMRKYPDRIIGQGVLDLDKHTPSAISEMKDAGFRALKITRPRKNYDDDSYMPLYEEAERQNMAILFHTGMILTTCFDKDDDVSSARMRPMFLDRVARRFPTLKMVLAHLGYPWFDEAATMARYHTNVFIDLTGSSYGWRCRLSPADFQRILFWKDAFQKIVFGTDVGISEIEEALTTQKHLFQLLNLDQETQDIIFYKNAQYLLGM
ncbi:MAG: amidohydrolase family protein [Lawsonibacter sp.]|jgi:predicted TIM-barrel fold metal-dependent hydrolase